MSSVRIDINEAELNALLYSPTGPVVREVESVARRVVNAAKRRAPVDEGTLRASIASDLQIHPGRVTARIGSNLFYAIFQELGTGIYGPSGQVIRPRTAKVLKFKARRATPRSRRGGGFVFAQFVKGSPGIHYLVDALIAESPWPVIR